MWSALCVVFSLDIATRFMFVNVVKRTGSPHFALIKGWMSLWFHGCNWSVYLDEGNIPHVQEIIVTPATGSQNLGQRLLVENVLCRVSCMYPTTLRFFLSVIVPFWRKVTIILEQHWFLFANMSLLRNVHNSKENDKITSKMTTSTLIFIRYEWL